MINLLLKKKLEKKGKIEDSIVVFVDMSAYNQKQIDPIFTRGKHKTPDFNYWSLS